MDEEAEKFFGMPLDFTFKGRTPGMVNLMDLSVGAGLVDPRDMGMNDI